MASPAAAGFDEPRPSQNAEMSGNCGAADWKTRGEIVDGEGRVPEPSQDLTAHRVAQSIQSVHPHCNCDVTTLN